MCAHTVTLAALVVTLVERKSDLDKRMWMQLVGNLAMILGH
jgi:hypothetical protein